MQLRKTEWSWLGRLFINSLVEIFFICIFKVCLCLVSQSCLTLCHPMDCSPPGSSVHGILQARTMECGWPCPPPGDLPNLGVELRSHALQEDTDSYHLSHQGSLFKVYSLMFWYVYTLWNNHYNHTCHFYRVQFSSVAQLCPTCCNPMDCSMPGFPVHHQLLELTQTHVHQVSDTIQPPHPVSSPSPPAFKL